MKTKDQRSNEDGALIPCFCCGAGAEIVRFAEIRDELAHALHKFISVCMPPAEKRAMPRAIERVRRNGRYVKTFCCQSCYGRIDSQREGEMVPFETSLGLRGFTLSRKSRHDAAPVYTFEKWLQYQRRQAAKLGVDLATVGGGHV